MLFQELVEVMENLMIYFNAGLVDQKYSVDEMRYLVVLLVFSIQTAACFPRWQFIFSDIYPFFSEGWFTDTQLFMGRSLYIYIYMQVMSTLQNFFLNTKVDLYLLQIDAKKVCTLSFYVYYVFHWFDRGIIKLLIGRERLQIFHVMQCIAHWISC